MHSPLFQQNNHIILASTSRGRKQVMDKTGVEYTAISPEDDEEVEKLEAHVTIMGPRTKSKHLAEFKGKRMSLENPNSIVIAGDQICAFNGVCVDKPDSKQGALDHLRRFNGKSIELHTSTCILKDGHIIAMLYDCPVITFHQMSEGFIKRYAERGEGVGIAGACTIEGNGRHLIKSKTGEHETIIGMQLLSLLNSFYESGILERLTD